jgi:hypothetical protein
VLVVRRLFQQISVGQHEVAAPGPETLCAFLVITHPLSEAEWCLLGVLTLLSDCTILTAAVLETVMVGGPSGLDLRKLRCH